MPAAACRHQGPFLVCEPSLILALTASAPIPGPPTRVPSKDHSPKEGRGFRFLVKGEERDGTHTHHKKKPMKNTSNKNQSSVPVQHSHTTDTAAASTAGAPAPERKDNRLPIDAEARKANRMLPTPKVLNLLLTTAPDVYKLAEVVGKWVWVQFKEQPAAEIRQTLAQLGFHWNRERQAWQHPCGKFSLSSAGDPHEKYSNYKPAFIRRKAKTEAAEPVAA